MSTMDQSNTISPLEVPGIPVQLPTVPPGPSPPLVAGDLLAGGQRPLPAGPAGGDGGDGALGRGGRAELLRDEGTLEPAPGRSCRPEGVATCWWVVG